MSTSFLPNLPLPNPLRCAETDATDFAHTLPLDPDPSDEIHRRYRSRLGAREEPATRISRPQNRIPQPLPRQGALASATSLISTGIFRRSRRLASICA